MDWRRWPGPGELRIFGGTALLPVADSDCRSSTRDEIEDWINGMVHYMSVSCTKIYRYVFRSGLRHDFPACLSCYFLITNPLKNLKKMFINIFIFK